MRLLTPHQAHPLVSSSSILVGEPKFTGFDHDQAAIGYLFEHRLNDAGPCARTSRLSDVDVTYRRITSRSLADDAPYAGAPSSCLKENNAVAIDTHKAEGAIKTGDVEHSPVRPGRRTPEDEQPHLHWRSGERSWTSSIRSTVDRIEVLTADFDDSGQRLSQLGLYAQDQMRLTRNWLVTLGGRMD